VQPDRRERRGIELPDAPERVEENPPLRLELRVEPELRPVAAAAFVGRRTGIAPPLWRRREQLDDLPSPEALLHFDDFDARHVARVDARNEEGEAIDAADRLAPRDERVWAQLENVTVADRRRAHEVECIAGGGA